MLAIDPTDAIPIWRQIEDEMRRMIAIGRLEPDDPVPSVRDLAKELRVNPATVSKAYQQLTTEGLLVVKRGEGTFVAAQPPKLAKAQRKRTMGTAARRYASLAATIGAAMPEAIEEVERAFSMLTGEGTTTNER